jgi:beta-glucanase (GH16 family)
MGRARVVMAAAGVAVLGAATALVLASADAGGAAGPTVSLPTAAISRAEGSAAATVTLTATLASPATTTVTVGYTTVAATAKANDSDYVAVKGTLTFAPGIVSRQIAIQVNGDGKPEEHEKFNVKLQKPVGATLGNAKQSVELLNDDIPDAVVKSLTVVPGKVAKFRPKLAHKYYQQLTVTAKTVNGTAAPPGDFSSVNRAVTFPANSKTAIKVDIPTVTNVVSEPTETFALQLSSGSRVLGQGTATLTGATTTPPGSTTSTTQPGGGGACPAGTIPTTPLPGAPASPSSPATLLPPAALTGGAQWDLVFQDEFADQAYTSSKWATGMRTGDRTLEGNTELQWYLPGNSVLTSDNDGTSSVGVLRQTLQRQQVAGTEYTVRTLSRVYPPAQCPQYYDPNGNNSTSSSNTSPTRTPYQFTSGMLNNSKSFGFKYGYVETRVKMPKGFSLWPALWLRDWNGWVYEIDVLEGFDRSSRTFRTGYYWGNGNNRSTENDGGDIGVTSNGTPCRQHVPIPATTQSQSDCSLANAIDLSAGYHTIGLNWTATKYELYFDGVKRWTSPAGADVAKDYNHLILNLAFGNNAYEFDWTDEPVKPFNPDLFSSTYFPKRTVEWDYVRVWQPANARDVCTPPNCD